MKRRPVEPLATVLLLLAASAATSRARLSSSEPSSSLEGGGGGGGLPSQTLETPYHGQHVGVAVADLNGDGAPDLLFAAGRHWVDQSYALINLGLAHDADADAGVGGGGFVGVRFSEALPIGPPGAYYQIDVVSSSSSSGGGVGVGVGVGASLGDDEDGKGLTSSRSTVLLVGGTCHFERPNSSGSCTKGENTPARVLEVTMAGGGCSVHRPDAPCRIDYDQVWEHPDPKGDRNGGFAAFGDRRMIALLGQGGIELFESVRSSTSIGDGAYAIGNDDGSGKGKNAQSFLHTSYSPVYRQDPPAKTDPRSDYARYAGFAAGRSPSLGGIVAAGRRSDYDAPQLDDNGEAIGINELVYEDDRGDGDGGAFRSSTLPTSAGGESYPGNPNYSLQSTGYAFADIDGDGVEDMLEATFLYESQRAPGYPLPQRVHFLDGEGRVRDTLVVLKDGTGRSGDGAGDNDAGRSVTAGKIFSDSALPDVVFASAEGVVTVFANLGVDEDTGKFLGLERRHELSVGTDKCQIRDVAIARLTSRDGSTGRCQVGIVCAVTCGIDVLGKNHIFYVEGDGAVCGESDDDGDNGTAALLGSVILQKGIE